MKKLLIAGLLLAGLALAAPAQAQTAPPLESLNPVPYSSPEPLNQVAAYNYLVNIIGTDPVTAAWIVTHSQTAHDFYQYVDQLLAGGFFPKP